MKKYSKYIILIGVILLATVLFIFTTNNNNSNTLNEVALDELPSTFNSAKSQQAGDSNMIAMTGATPLTTNREGKVINYAAQKVETLNSGKTIKITLKNGLKYQDGTQVVAQDYKSAINMLVNPRTKASFSSWATNWIVGAQAVFENKAKEVSGIKIISNNVFEINLLQPYTFFKTTLSSAVWTPIPQKWIQSHGGVEHYGAKYDQLLSSGEYKIKKYAKDQYIEYEKIQNSVLANSDTPKTVRFTSYKIPDAIAHDFKNKKVNSVLKTEVTDKILGYKKETKAQDVTEEPTVQYLANGGLSINNMKALYLALDKNYIVDNFFYGIGRVRNQMTPNNYLTEKYYKNANKNEYDLEQAKKLIDKNLKVVRFQIRSAQPQSYQAFVKYIVNQWEKLGLKVELSEVPFGPNDGTMGENTKERKYDVTFGTWGEDYPHAYSFTGQLLGSNTSTAYSYWNNDQRLKYDELIDLASKEVDENKSNELFAKAAMFQKDNAQLLAFLQRQHQQYIQKNGWITYSNGHVLKPSLWVKLK